MSDKPLGHKAYGHIAHLPGSRMGPGDHKCHEGQARIATERVRDRKDVVWVQEKLDGSCVSVAKIDGQIIPLGRAGYTAISSPFRMHHMFHAWAIEQWSTFDHLLRDGERVVGEWLAQAHGTRYDLTGRDPFVAFDIMRGTERVPFRYFINRVEELGIAAPATTPGPLSIEAAMEWLGPHGFYGSIDPVEGAVWRVERSNAVDFLAKYVRPDKVDGSYLDSVTGGEPIWNWLPLEDAA